MQSLEPICTLINNIPGTFISSVWFWISHSFAYYWHLIIPATICWFFYEIFTRNTHSYNSANGFTPALNSFVGGGVFYILNALLNFVLSFIIGNGADCGLILINSLYLIPFVFTGIFLHGIGFWPHMKLPTTKTRKGARKRNRKW